jgi:hypothetical protein
MLTFINDYFQLTTCAITSIAVNPTDNIKKNFYRVCTFLSCNKKTNLDITPEGLNGTIAGFNLYTNADQTMKIVWKG